MIVTGYSGFTVIVTGYMDRGFTPISPPTGSFSGLRQEEGDIARSHFLLLACRQNGQCFRLIGEGHSTWPII